MRPVALLEGELGIEVCLQQGLGSDRGQESSVDNLLVRLPLVGHGGALRTNIREGGREREGRTKEARLKPRTRRPPSVEHRHVGGTGRRARRDKDAQNRTFP